MRLTAYYKLVPEPKSYREAVATAISLMRVAQVPFRDPRKEEALNTGGSLDADRLWYGVQTNWLSAIDLTHKVWDLCSSAKSMSSTCLQRQDSQVLAEEPL